MSQKHRSCTNVGRLDMEPSEIFKGDSRTLRGKLHELAEGGVKDG
jgi:hypothetical protein